MKILNTLYSILMGLILSIACQNLATIIFIGDHPTQKVSIITSFICGLIGLAGYGLFRKGIESRLYVECINCHGLTYVWTADEIPRRPIECKVCHGEGRVLIEKN